MVLAFFSEQPRTEQISRGEAMGWEPVVVPMHLISDLAVGASFMGVGGMFLYIAFRAYSHIPFQWSLFVIGIMVMLDGGAHILSAANVFNTDYGLAAAVKYADAILAVGTLFAVPPFLKRRIQIYEQASQSERNRRKLESLNESLQEQIEWRTRDLQAAKQRAQQLVGQVVKAQQEERKRLSYEVHDGLTQTAIASHQHLQAFFNRNRHLFKDTIPEHDVNIVLKMARQVIRDSRDLIDQLSPTVLDDFGLSAAIRQKVRRLIEEGWNIEYLVSGEPHIQDRRLDSEVETTLYRIFQECIHNIRKHAHASFVEVMLDLSGKDTVMLAVRDDGVGFDIDDSPDSRLAGPGERIGLSSMKERVSLMGGRFRISSQIGEGTTVYAEIPASVHPWEEEVSTHNEAKEGAATP